MIQEEIKDAISFMVLALSLKVKSQWILDGSSSKTSSPPCTLLEFRIHSPGFFSFNLPKK